MKTQQPLWDRGVMVSPQHFQQQAAYAAWSAECIAQRGLNHPWGVIRAEFEPEILKLGRLQARHLHVRFQDGTLGRDCPTPGRAAIQPPIRCLSRPETRCTCA